MAGIKLYFQEKKKTLTKDLEEKFMTQIDKKDKKDIEIESKHFGMNSAGSHLLWLKDMGNDIETWFVKNMNNNTSKDIGNFNYRNSANYLDYSEKYEVFFYILDIYNYKNGSYYELHIHYKDKEYEARLSYGNYCKLSIDSEGENLLISIRDKKIMLISLNSLVSSLDVGKYEIDITSYIDEKSEKSEQEAQRKKDEAKASYRMTYSHEFGDD